MICSQVNISIFFSHLYPGFDVRMKAQIHDSVDLFVPTFE